MFMIMLMPAIAILSLGMMPSAASADGGGGLPDGFVYVTDVAPDALLDIRYYGTNNFVGERIDSYLAPVAILTVQAADALKRATDELRNKGFVIKIFDAYRPAAAVAHFARWAADSRDTRKKADFYPDVAKSDLHRKGYIAKRSSHSRGSALDLTIVHADSGREADMGSPFDFFGEISHHGANGITSEQKANRDILRSAMERAGFRALKTEWWHYSLADEPFSDKYFDFPVDGPNPEMAEALDRLALSIPAEKLIVVTGGRSASRVDVRAYERINGVWTLSLRTDGFVGKGGVSDEKREGDGATPSGVYSFGRAFGAADDPGSTTPYTKLRGDCLWVNDPGSAYYNMWVEGDVPDKDWRSAEKLSSETVAYRYAIAIEYNTNPIVPGAGSAIFLHCVKKGPTAGCVSVPEDAMIRLLKFIDGNTKIAIAKSEDELSPSENK